MMYVALSLQLFASVIETVYVPEGIPTMLDVVREFDHKKLYRGVPPIGET
jgi:hypothetical protein